MVPHLLVELSPSDWAHDPIHHSPTSLCGFPLASHYLFMCFQSTKQVH